MPAIEWGLRAEDRAFGRKMLRGHIDVSRMPRIRFDAGGMDGLAAFAADSMESFRRWSERALQSDAARALIAPWVLHTGLGPDDACSALIGKLTFAAVVAGGMPVVKGGGSGVVDALAAVIERRGGRLQTGTEVERIITSGQGKRRRAVGAEGASSRRSCGSPGQGASLARLLGRLLFSVKVMPFQPAFRALIFSSAATCRCAAASSCVRASSAWTSAAVSRRKQAERAFPHSFVRRVESGKAALPAPLDRASKAL